jgi:DNA-binding NarL/FixJ family response regulator
VAKTRILLVDDFKPWRLAARRILSAVPDFQIVGEASDGMEAIEKAATLLPDTVLLDIGMPLLNGLAAAKRIRQVSPESKIIFLSQQDDEDLRSAAFATGAEAYIVKSRAARELQLTLESSARNVSEPGVLRSPSATSSSLP